MKILNDDELFFQNISGVPHDVLCHVRHSPSHMARSSGKFYHILRLKPFNVISDKMFKNHLCVCRLILFKFHKFNSEVRPRKHSSRWSYWKCLNIVKKIFQWQFFADHKYFSFLVRTNIWPGGSLQRLALSSSSLDRINSGGPPITQ